MNEKELKVYADNQINWLKGLLDSELRSIREAVYKETKINTEKFANNNEWKDTIKETVSRNPSREEMNPKLEQMGKRIDELKSALDQFQGVIRFLQFAGVAGVLALVITVLRMTGVVK